MPMGSLIVIKWLFDIGRVALLSVAVLVSAITSQTEAASPPPEAVRAACMSDAQRLCAAVIGNLPARRACMTEHRAELSAGCKAAIAQWRGRGSGGPQASQAGDEVPSGPNRRARCAAYVQDYSFHAGAAWKINGGKAALARCMHGQSIGF
jgi:hypothetical protein